MTGCESAGASQTETILHLTFKDLRYKARVQVDATGISNCTGPGLLGL